MARASKMKAPPFGKKSDSEGPKKGKNPFAKKDAEAEAEADPNEGDEMDSIFGEEDSGEDTSVVTLADATIAQLEDELAKRQEEEDNSESEDEMDDMFGGETDEEDVV